MLAFKQSLGLEFGGAFVHGSPLSWIARNSSKPGRDVEPETWVLHASSEWTRGSFGRISGGGRRRFGPRVLERGWTSSQRSKVQHGTSLAFCSYTGNFSGKLLV